MKNLILIGATSVAFSVEAHTWIVHSNADLFTFLKGARPYDTLVIRDGEWKGNFVIDKPLTIIGSVNSVLNAQGKGHVLHIKAPDVTVENLTLINSDNDLSGMNAGIFIDKKAHNAVIMNNQIRNNLFGIYVWGGESAFIYNNKIIGLDYKRLNDRGNGINLWNTPHTIIRNNNIELGRDGIFTNNTKYNLFDGNTFSNLRFAVHYMYTENSTVKNNYAENVDSAYVLMFSRDIKVINNKAKNSIEHGLMLNSVNEAEIFDNKIEKASKCTFIYNANLNNFYQNEFKNCAIGIHLTAGSENNKIYRNSFIGNQSQVKYVGTRLQEWSHNKIGNYWSDNSGFDLNGDGISDTPYKPNNVLDEVLWRAPNAKILTTSPSAQLLKYVQQQFPAIHPGGAQDSFPLMKNPNGR